MPSTQTGNATADNNYKVTLSSNTPTLSGYEFQGWCSSSTSDGSCSGTSYSAGGSITITSNNQTINLYAKWKSTLPSNYGQTCNSTGKVLKDGKCWMKTDATTSVQWAQASSYCSGVWHLPSQAEFNALIRAYSGSTSAFAADWGATSGFWWSSHANPNPSFSTYAYGLSLNLYSVSSYGANHKTGNGQVRCVSS